MTKERDDLKKKLSALDPRFKKQINDLFEKINESVSMLYEVAIHDEKTGIYNHKFFDTILDMELEKAKRQQERLSLIILDIDFFKKINDNYGHFKADELLKKLAQLISKEIRKSDVVARFGGEEFIILLPETSLEKAKKLSIRLRTAIKNDKLLKKYSLTVSGGIAEYKQRDTKKKLKERADKALYIAKNSGRDRFIILE